MKRFGSHPDELISASLTGDLTPAERRELDAHLAACPECRATLDAFALQRQLLSQIPEVPMPRDLGARVRSRIDSGRFGAWWRRPGFWLGGVATLGTVAAGALLAFFLVNRPSPPNVGQQTPSPTPSSTVSAAPSTSASASASSSALPLGMKPGDLVYAQLTGPFNALKLTIIDAAGGAKVSLQDPKGGQYGAVQRAALSPDGRLLAFATDSGLKGTWRIFVANLADGTVQQLAETLPVTFGRRLAWSPDGRYLAFTVAPLDGNASISSVWIYDRTTEVAKAVTGQGSAGPPAYFASWAPVGPGNNEQLWVSLGESNPVSQLGQFPVDGGTPGDLLGGETTTVNGVYAPLVSPDGNHVLYWTGTLRSDGSSGWDFGMGGMPQLATYDPTATTWAGKPLFSDVTPQQGGAAFSSGELSWADDSDAYAFWSGQWTGTPEGTNYPDPNAVYVGRASAGVLSQASALDPGPMTSGGKALYLVDVSLSPSGDTASVTLGVPLSGDLSAPESYLRAVPVGGGSAIDVGSGGASPPPWSGPGRFVPGSVGS